MNNKIFNLILKDPQRCGYWRGVEPHPEKKLGIFIYDNKAVVAEVAMTEVNRDFWYRSLTKSKVAVTLEVADERIADADLLAFGIIVQGRDDWQGTEFTSTDNCAHPEDAKWDTVLWEDSVRCPVCRQGDLVPEHGDEDERGIIPLYGRICPECGFRARSDAPVPRRWSRDLASLAPGEYSDEYLSERPFLREVFGITEEDFPEEGEVEYSFPELNHFDRISYSGTVMWSIPTVTLRWDGTFEVDAYEDAVSRVKRLLREHGEKVNRGKAIYRKLDRKNY